MTILVTGAAGFIGYHVCKKLLSTGNKVIGIDNLNDYYDVRLKKARLEQLENEPHFSFLKRDISDKNIIDEFCSDEITSVIHLAAQAGVRYSIENPFAYMQSNLVGHLVVLELCRKLQNLEHLVYASSSSVYGGNTKLPFSTSDNTDSPVSLYAATKKSDELLTHSYSHLYGIPATGLRFFTVYGEWGRPDMAYFSFTKAILEQTPIRVFNHGKLKRDFTYIGDIVDGVIACLEKPPVAKENAAPHNVYNLGNSKSVPVLEFIRVLEKAVGKKAILQMEDMQQGDVMETFADISDAKKDFGYNPKTSIKEGLPLFIDWFKHYNLSTRI